MQKENVKQTDIDEAGMADQSDQAESAHTGEEQMRNEQITEERNEQNKRLQDDEKFAPLFERDEAEQFRAQWLDIQSRFVRSEEHTSELQSQSNLVCRLLLEK